MNERIKKIKLTGAVNLRLDQDEVAATETLAIKGIKSIHVYRRGLDAYLTDLIKNEDIPEEK